MNESELRAVLSSIDQVLTLLEREPVPGDFERKALAELQRLRADVQRRINAAANRDGPPKG